MVLLVNGEKAEMFEIELDFIDSVSIESMREFTSNLTRDEARFLAIGLCISLLEIEEVGDHRFLTLESQFAIDTLHLSLKELRELCFELWQQIIVSDALFDFEEGDDE
jgi:hypothetical protein